MRKLGNLLFIKKAVASGHLVVGDANKEPDETPYFVFDVKDEIDEILAIMRRSHQSKGLLENEHYEALKKLFAENVFPEDLFLISDRGQWVTPLDELVTAHKEYLVLLDQVLEEVSGENYLHFPSKVVN